MKYENLKISLNLNYDNIKNYTFWWIPSPKIKRIIHEVKRLDQLLCKIVKISNDYMDGEDKNE